MTVFDLVVILVVALSAAIGVWRGLVEESMALLAWGAALTAAWLFGAAVGDTVFFAIKDPALRTAAGAVAIILLVLVGMALLKLGLHRLFKALRMTRTDRVLGLVFGLARGVLVVFLMVVVAGLTSVPQQSWWKDANMSPPFETAALAMKPMLPSDIAKRIRY